ncbi:unnamed protein product [[Candida] boidinii]|nr:unnamed protein product [[Candida] boidinii]
MKTKNMIPKIENEDSINATRNEIEKLMASENSNNNDSDNNNNKKILNKSTKSLKTPGIGSFSINPKDGPDNPNNPPIRRRNRMPLSCNVCLCEKYNVTHLCEYQQPLWANSTNTANTANTQTTQTTITQTTTPNNHEDKIGKLLSDAKKLNATKNIIKRLNKDLSVDLITEFNHNKNWEVTVSEDNQKLKKLKPNPIATPTPTELHSSSSNKSDYTTSPMSTTSSSYSTSANNPSSVQSTKINSDHDQYNLADNNVLPNLVMGTASSIIGIFGSKYDRVVSSKQHHQHHQHQQQAQQQHHASSMVPPSSTNSPSTYNPDLYARPVNTVSQLDSNERTIINRSDNNTKSDPTNSNTNTNNNSNGALTQFPLKNKNLDSVSKSSGHTNNNNSNAHTLPLMDSPSPGSFSVGSSTNLPRIDEFTSSSSSRPVLSELQMLKEKIKQIEASIAVADLAKNARVNNNT